MEPERKIEKLLRTYAEKRRRQAGDPLELHPATRRLLQGEAARHAPKAKESGFFSTIFHLLRSGWAFASVIAVAGLSVALLLPALLSSKTKTTEMAQRGSVRDEELAPASPAAIPPPATEPRSAQEPLKRQSAQELLKQETETLDSLSVVQKEKKLDSNLELAEGRGRETPAAIAGSSVVQTTAVPTSFSDFAQRNGSIPDPATAPTTTKDASLADAASVRTFSAQTGQMVEERARADDFETAAATRGFAGGGGGGGGRGGSIAAPNQVRFYRYSEGAGAVTTDARTPEQRSTALGGRNLQSAGVISNVLLSSFGVEQNGGDLRVVDRDGSIYTGNVQLEIAVPAETATPARAPATPAPARNERSRDALAERLQNYSFRVTGTNRSLRQKVVFSGSLVTTTNALPPGWRAGVATVNQPASVSGVPPMILSNSFISGTAVVGDGQAMEIRAAPAGVPMPK